MCVPRLSRKHWTKIKMLISYDDDRVKELIVHNELCNLVAEQHDEEASDEDDMFTFHRIVDHKGPLKAGDSECNGCQCNVKIEWEDAGASAWEPLTVIGKCDPVTCAAFAKDNELRKETNPEKREGSPHR